MNKAVGKLQVIPMSKSGVNNYKFLTHTDIF